MNKNFSSRTNFWKLKNMDSYWIFYLNDIRNVFWKFTTVLLCYLVYFYRKHDFNNGCLKVCASFAKLLKSWEAFSKDSERVRKFGPFQATLCLKYIPKTGMCLARMGGFYEFHCVIDAAWKNVDYLFETLIVHWKLPGLGTTAAHLHRGLTES